MVKTLTKIEKRALMERIVSAYERPMRRMCLSFSCHDAFVADELYSGLLIRLWNSIEFLPKEQEDEAKWIYTVARNAAIDYGRCHPKLDLVPFDEERLHIVAEDDDALRDELYRLIDLLDDEERGIVLMKLNGRTAKEIGRKLGVTSRHVDNRYSKIVKKMKTIYNKRKER